MGSVAGVSVRMSEVLALMQTHERNVHSQCGEDGVIAAIFHALGVTGGTAVEFGAWDGVYLSNTAALREAGWDTCLIEGDPARYAALAQRFSGDPKVVTVEAWVRATGDSSLDAILSRRFPKPIDLLSIDIDGDDCHVFANLVVRPRVVVIEFNPTIPPFIERLNPAGKVKGSSLAALTRLANQKGYELVYATVFNAIFIDAARNGRVRARHPYEVFHWNYVNFVVNDFDGENWFANVAGQAPQITNPWDGLPSAFLVEYPPETLVAGDAGKAARTNFLKGTLSRRRT
jgi:hypothetical protein